MLNTTRYASAGSTGQFARLARARQLTMLGILGLMLTACGGGTGRGSDRAPTGASGQPVPAGSVTVRTITSSGAPVSDAGVTLNGSFNGRSARTDADGEVHFEGIPAGEARIQAFRSGYHEASRRFAVTGDPVTTVTVVMENASKATPVVLGVHGVPSDDGTTLVADVDIAVLDENGRGRELVSADDVQVQDCDGEWSYCVIDADRHGTSVSYTAQVLSVTPQTVPTGSRLPLATAVLLDEGTGTGTFDPAGRRLAGVNGFLESIAPPDMATVAAYWGVAEAPGFPDTPVLQVLGEFTSDAATLTPAVTALAGRESGSSPTLAALTSLAAYVREHTAAGSAAPKRSVVVVTHNPSGGDCWYVTPCYNASLDAVGAALAGGLSLNLVGGDGAITWAVFRTGGFFADIRDPTQLPVALRNLDSLIGRNVAYSRVRIELHSGTGAFVPGSIVFGDLSVRVGPDTRLILSTTVAF